MALRWSVKVALGRYEIQRQRRDVLCVSNSVSCSVHNQVALTINNSMKSQVLKSDTSYWTDYM